jgi:uncharacterized RDD family membrane protein YckC
MTTTPPEPPDAGGQPGYGAPPPPEGYGAPAGGYGNPMAPIPAPPGEWAGPPLAEWPARALGAVIDGVIGWIPQFLLSKMGAPLFGQLVGLVIWLYFMYLQGTTGQTPGKKVAKIKLLREADGQVVGFPLAIGRGILHIVDLIPCGVGFLWPLWDKKKQTFADKIVSTVVIKAD